MMARRRLSETAGFRPEDRHPETDQWAVSYLNQVIVRFALKKLATSESRKEPEKRAGPKPAEVKTSHLSQAHLLAGAVKRRSSSQSSDSSKRQKVEEPTVANAGRTEQEAGGGAAEQGSTVKATGVLHLPSAAVCVGILPGLGAYSGSSDSESSSDSEV
ncbi:hypothetical protein UPYG_G00263330 [Umbra pygmaea]|uniref:Uncharacterized protein n=1 Tax=Umbra pygmaea TaxID=75934 RepID=A0ABD0WZQ6_UMBPY